MFLLILPILCELASRCETIQINFSSYCSVTGTRAMNWKIKNSFRNLQYSYYLSTFISSKTWTKCWNETFFMKNFFVTIETRSVRKNKILKRRHRNTTCRCIFQLLQLTLFSFFLQNNNVSGYAIYFCIIFYLPLLLSTTKTFTFMFIFPVSPVSHSVCRKNQETAW